MTIKVDMKLLSYRDMAKVGHIIHDELGVTLAALQDSPDAPLAAAAFAVVWSQKWDPEHALTFDQAAELPMGEIEVVSDPEGQSGNNGAAPLLLPASGI